MNIHTGTGNMNVNFQLLKIDKNIETVRFCESDHVIQLRNPLTPFEKGGKSRKIM